MSIMIEQDVNVYGKGNIFEFDNNIIANYYPRRIIELVGDKNKTCLELGIGYGITTEIFSNFFDRYVVLEGDKKMIDRYNNMHPDTNARIIETYFEDWNAKETFDVIILGFILEHVEAPNKILKKYANLLSEGGRMYITVPNAEALNRRVGKEAGILEDLYQLSENDIRLGHKRYYTLDSLRKEIQADNIGLKIINEEGIYLKPITTSQMMSLNLSDDIIRGFLNVGKDYPELGLGLMMETERI